VTPVLRAITHKVSPRIAECELTFLDRGEIDFELAAQQHNDYESTLSRLGVTVTSLNGNEAYPDACFVEDTAIVVDEIAVICSMGVASRRGEPELIARELGKYRKLAKVQLPATVEGGDVLIVGKQLFVGQSNRTNQEGIAALANLLSPLGYKVTPVHTFGSLHLKSACSTIDEETLFVNPDWIDIEPFADFRLLTTPQDEPGAANVLRIGTTICVQPEFGRTIELLARVADRVEVVDMSELRKAEAGLTCSSIVFESEK
jgi:dimethylargininase